MCEEGLESIAYIYIWAGADYEALWRSLVRPNYIFNLKLFVFA